MPLLHEATRHPSAGTLTRTLRRLSTRRRSPARRAGESPSGNYWPGGSDVVSMAGTAYVLSEDRRTLVIKRRMPAGIQAVTLHRQDGAGPFTGDDVTAALAATERSAERMEQGQRNITRRAVTRYGTLWTHVMAGPPTWWMPRVKREKDGTLMAGWLRLAVAVRFDRAERREQLEADPWLRVS